MEKVRQVLKITPTFKQKKLALAVAKNIQAKKPLNKRELLESVSYGKIAKQPQRIFEGKGYLQAIRDLGLTEELVTTSLYEDIQKKPQNRVKELTLASNILGMVKHEEQKQAPTNATYNFLFNETTQKQIKDIEDKIKQRLLEQ